MNIKNNLKTKNQWSSFTLICTTSTRGCEDEFMDGCSRMDVTQSEGDLPDFNKSEH